MDEFRKDESMVVTPTTVRERIDSALEKLAHFGSREDKAESRQDIIAELCKDLSEYYGYIEELTEFLLDLFSPAECVEYMDASDRPRPLVIRANTLKTNRKDLMELLVKRGAVVEAIDWSKVAIKVTESSVPIGATPEVRRAGMEGSCCCVVCCLLLLLWWCVLCGCCGGSGGVHCGDSYSLTLLLCSR
jgi:ribosomal RNA methyltransferase Nop2